MGKGAYAGGRVECDEVAGALDEDVRPVALLVDDTCAEARVVEPRCGRAAGKALSAAKGSVLYSGCAVKRCPWI